MAISRLVYVVTGVPRFPVVHYTSLLDFTHLTGYEPVSRIRRNTITIQANFFFSFFFCWIFFIQSPVFTRAPHLVLAELPIHRTTTRRFRDATIYRQKLYLAHGFASPRKGR
jgi:hypothetical protein